MKHVVEHERTLELLARWSGQKPAVLESHFFSSYKNGLQTPGAALAAHLRRLVERQHDSKWTGFRPGLLVDSGGTVEAVSTGKKESALHFRERSVPVCIVIDALDEYDGVDLDFQELLTTIGSLHDIPNVKVLLASRHNMVAEKLLSDHTELRLDRYTHQDIHTYVRSCLERPIESKGYHPQIADISRISTSLTEKAQGMFLWAKLAIQALTGDAERSLQQPALVLDHMPASLQGILAQHIDSRSQSEIWYLSQTLQLIKAWDDAELGLLGNGFDRGLPFRTLLASLIHERWMQTGSSVDMMTELEVQDARTLLDRNWSPLLWCERNESDVESDSWTVYLVHLSVKDYLLGDEQTWQKLLEGGPRSFDPTSALLESLLQKAQSIVDPARLLRVLLAFWRIGGRSSRYARLQGQMFDECSIKMPSRFFAVESRGMLEDLLVPHTPISWRAFEEYRPVLKMLSLRHNLSNAQEEVSGTHEEDLDSDLDDCASLFSEASASSSITSAQSSTLPSKVIEDFASLLFHTAELKNIASVALSDPCIDLTRLCRNLRRLIVTLGGNIRLEARLEREKEAANLLRTRTVSTLAAQHVVSLYDAAVSELESTMLVNTAPDTRLQSSDSHNDGRDGALEDADSNASDSDDSIEEVQPDAGLDPQDLEGLRSFFVQSEAYNIFKVGLLEFVHRPYKRRLGLAVIQSADRQSEVGYARIQELSWVPPELVSIQEEVHTPAVDLVKEWVEVRLRQQCNWWPLNQRVNRLRKDHFRLTWRTVSKP